MFFRSGLVSYGDCPDDGSGALDPRHEFPRPLTDGVAAAPGLSRLDGCADVCVGYPESGTSPGHSTTRTAHPLGWAPERSERPTRAYIPRGTCIPPWVYATVGRRSSERTVYVLPRPVPDMRQDRVGRLRSTCRRRHEGCFTASAEIGRAHV